MRPPKPAIALGEWFSPQDGSRTGLVNREAEPTAISPNPGPSG